MSALLLAALTTFCASGATPKRVLILDSFGRDIAPFNAGGSAFRTTLARELGEPVDIYEASLDAARFIEPEKEGPFVEFLKSRFESRLLDLVVPVGAPAVRFMAKYRESLFANTPIVFMATEPRLIPPALLQTNATLVTQRVNLPGFVEDILQMQPDTTNIVVVIGASPLEKFWAGETRREFLQFTNRVGFTWLNDLSLEQMEQRIAVLPPHSFVLFAMLVVDASGVPYDGNAPLQRLHAVANAPIFGYFGSQFGSGAIGGRLYQDTEVGARAARAAIRILHGERPEKIAPQILEASNPIYDWRELKQWQIPESRLPVGREIRFRQPTLWEAYRGRIIAVLVLCFGEAVLITLLMVNLRHRKLVERSLRESEERLQLATDSAGSGLVSVDLNTGAIWVTAKLREILHLPENGALTQARFLELVEPQDRDAIRQQVQKAVANGQLLRIEYRCVLADGSNRWLKFRGCSRIGPTGTAERLTGVCWDITERKQADTEAQELRDNLAHLARVNTLGALSGSLAHELNQPLGIILTNTEAAQELLLQNPPDLVEAQAILSDIAAADRRAAHVIERLRALFKRGQISLQPLKLDQVIEEVLKLVHAELMARSVIVVRHWAENLPLVMGDRVQLQQLGLNLILNAADAMTDNASGTRRLHLQTSFQADKVCVSVRDEGIGLPPDPEQLFQSFYTTKPHGLGMGLPICRTIADAHQGRLWAERHPERGAVFHFELPALVETI